MAKKVYSQQSEEENNAWLRVCEKSRDMNLGEKKMIKLRSEK